MIAATATEGRGVYKAGGIRRALMVVVKRRVVKRLLALVERTHLF